LLVKTRSTQVPLFFLSILPLHLSSTVRLISFSFSRFIAYSPYIFIGTPLSKRSSVAVGSLGSPTVAAIVGENSGLADVARAAIRRDAAGVATAAQALAATTEDLVGKRMWSSEGNKE
jgi:hypothetical protein